MAKAVQIGRRTAPGAEGAERFRAKRDEVSVTCGAPRSRYGEAIRGAVPCLSTDLTTHVVPHFTGFANGKAHGAEGAERFRAKRDEVSVTCEAPRSRCG